MKVPNKTRGEIGTRTVSISPLMTPTFRSRRGFLSMSAGHVLAGIASAQSNGKKESEAALLRANDIPATLERFHRVISERVEKAGKERLVSVGNLQEKASSKPIVLRFELPGRYRLEKDGKAILGSAAGAPSPQSGLAANDDEDDLIESMFLDRHESALYSVAQGASLRVIGYQVRATRSSIGYVGPYFDIFEITGKVDGKSGSGPRSKRFFFDSMSGLLQRVHYVVARRGVSLPIETRFSQWALLDGVPLPGRVERWESGVNSLQFSATSHTLSGKAADGLFEKV